MANSFINCNLHCVFSTKNREHMVTPDIRERLWAYMGGVAREKNIKALAIGGTSDHAHLLISIPATITIADSMKFIKGASSVWVNETFSARQPFAWQAGYGAFSTSTSRLKQTIAYIGNQENHHRKLSFMDEFRALLKKHAIPYDERFVWG